MYRESVQLILGKKLLYKSGCIFWGLLQHIDIWWKNMGLDPRTETECSQLVRSCLCDSYKKEHTQQPYFYLCVSVCACIINKKGSKSGILEKELALFEEAVLNAPQGVALGGGAYPSQQNDTEGCAWAKKNNVEHCRKFKMKEQMVLY